MGVGLPSDAQVPNLLQQRVQLMSLSYKNRVQHATQRVPGNNTTYSSAPVSPHSSSSALCKLLDGQGMATITAPQTSNLRQLCKTCKPLGSKLSTAGRRILLKFGSTGEEASYSGLGYRQYCSISDCFAGILRLAKKQLCIRAYLRPSLV